MFINKKCVNLALKPLKPLMPIVEVKNEDIVVKVVEPMKKKVVKTNENKAPETTISDKNNKE